MSAAAANYVPAELDQFNVNVNRAAHLLYNRLQRVRTNFATELDWICNQASNLYHSIKQYVNDRRLDDLLFITAACRANGDTPAEMQTKLEDVAKDYTLTMDYPPVNRQYIQRMVWKFYVLRELYFLFLKQINKTEKSGKRESDLPGELLVSVYALQKGLEQIGSYCTLHHSEQFIFN
ncbi:MAG: hypothetical protein MUC87_18415 [Bacteroidia bacterium]|jgi:hypothetical protein|nr:hypothetical protein [Bacteroidia bacterium]